jgi:hypothetical protein
LIISSNRNEHQIILHDGSEALLLLLNTPNSGKINPQFTREILYSCWTVLAPAVWRSRDDGLIDYDCMKRSLVPGHEYFTVNQSRERESFVTTNQKEESDFITDQGK